MYNVEDYITDCLDSLQNQNYSDYEIILIDDGSLDRSGEICEVYAKDDSRISVIHQKNAGVSAARNNGLRKAKGDYVTFVDSDDWVDSDYLMILAKYMQVGGMAACSYIREKWKENSQAANWSEQKSDTVVSMDKARAELSVLNWQEINGGCCAKIFDRDILIQNNIVFQEEITHGEDQLFVINYLSCTTRETLWIKRMAYHYRMNPKSACGAYLVKRQDFNEKDFSGIEAFEQEKKYIENTVELQRALRASVVRWKIEAVHAMYINSWQRNPLYKVYLKDIRKNFMIYFCNTKIGERAVRKIAAVACCIHPALYHLVWRIGRQKKLKG